MSDWVGVLCRHGPTPWHTCNSPGHATAWHPAGQCKRQGPRHPALIIPASTF
jgi:hypothetical protein